MSRLKIQHHTACVLDRMEHKVLPPGCKHDSHSPTLHFSRLSSASVPTGHELLPLWGTGGKRRIGTGGFDRLVMDSHGDAR